MNLLGRVALLPERTLHRLLVGGVVAAATAYAALAISYFPDARGKLGDDYEYFLPLLLAGKYWIAENGLLTPPIFSPAFCGGLPFLANPQSIFYSVPQALALLTDPVRSFLGTALIFAAVGAVGMFALMRRRFAVSVPAAWLSAIIFLFNGFLLQRLAIGQVTYHALGLAPLLCCLLLTPLGPETTFLRHGLRAAGPIALAAAILAYCVYAGAPNMLVPLGIACVAVWLMLALVRRPMASFWMIGAAAVVLGATASAAKLAPAAAFVLNFPRAQEIVILDNVFYLVHVVFIGFFLPMFLPERIWVVGAHEFEFGVGLVPFVLALAAIDRRGVRNLFRVGNRFKALLLMALGLLLAVPIWLNYGGPEHAAFLKTLPYIGENVILVRWFFIYLMPLVVGAGLALDYVCRLPGQRYAAALAGVLATAVVPLIADRPYYDHLPYDPTEVMAADEALRTGGPVPAITRIAAREFGGRNDGLAAGESAHPCYEPLFGYQLQSFPPRLTAGPILSGIPGGRHLRNPACYIYGPENGCRPGADFADTQRPEESAFAAYRSFPYVVPAWQLWANRISLVGLAAILLGCGVEFGRWCRDRVSRRSMTGGVMDNSL